MREDFAAIIISHGRPDCKTIEVLKKYGYTGRYYIVVDDEDEALSEYKKNYGEHVHVFKKMDNFDLCDNFDGPKGVATYARNECWNVAEKNKVKYFIMFDDDLESMGFRYIKDDKLKGMTMSNIDRVFEAYCEVMDNTNITCTGFGNVIDYIGGIAGFESRRNKKRGIVNAFFLRTSDRFDFCGRYSEDTITPVTESIRGKIFLGFIDVYQVFDVWMPSRKNKLDIGGCQEAYKNNNSYVLRFYAVMYQPSCVCIRSSKDNGWDNGIATNNAYPKIISERWKR